MPDLTSAWGRQNRDLLTKAFDPSEARATDGEWTNGSGGSSSGSRLQVTDPGQRQRNVRQQRADQAGARSADHAHVAALRDKLKTPRGDPAKLKAAADKAVAAVRKEVGISSSRLPEAHRNLAKKIESAARSLVYLRAREARISTHIQAIKTEMAAGNLGPKTKAYLQHQLDSASKTLCVATAARKSAEGRLAVAKHDWSKR